MKPKIKGNKKTLLIAGGVVLAVGAMYLVKRKQPAPTATENTEPPIVGPSSYFPLGETLGIGGGGGSVERTGGGAPATPTPGVTTTPELEHNFVCKPNDTQPNCRPRTEPPPRVKPILQHIPKL